MRQVALLIILLVGAAALFVILTPQDDDVQVDSLPDWDMRQEIQQASDTERNPWKRERDM
ncbi:hypothetical protein MHM84_00985 [Halomonas sp. McH1-25]|uniref:hypothetical protein n=1 Tax=unclassified Halomonas TaxID=2609666 RepID=UPI001EF60AEB|nr:MULTISPECIES: hypothetical protein [unclassified Halomonas]MCG7598356.1 hypothetical protein [Halomonas sp. McH1-25]MCP1342702.1 hypothetical protein [Halomonas sp. FL8]MCP1362173.1 hypothetical protein [Halomonas sp. BBD45]MCP1364227.1 hypothetical protein [Halomonas sp. BBD48]